LHDPLSVESLTSLLLELIQFIIDVDGFFIWVSFLLLGNFGNVRQVGIFRVISFLGRLVPLGLGLRHSFKLLMVKGRLPIRSFGVFVLLMFRKCFTGLMVDIRALVPRRKVFLVLSLFIGELLLDLTFLLLLV